MNRETGGRNVDIYQLEGGKQAMQFFCTSRINRLSTWMPLLFLTFIAGGVQAQESKPNILVIMGDDIGIPNISHLSFGMMGYKTPNIDRIAKEGMLFTDYYAEQSCTEKLHSLFTSF